MATIDIHCHPGLKRWLFNSNFETDHPTLCKEFLATDMVADYPKNGKGGEISFVAQISNLCYGE